MATPHTSTTASSLAQPHRGPRPGFPRWPSLAVRHKASSSTSLSCLPGWAMTSTAQHQVRARRDATHTAGARGMGSALRPFPSLVCFHPTTLPLLSVILNSVFVWEKEGGGGRNSWEVSGEMRMEAGPGPSS